MVLRACRLAEEISAGCEYFLKSQLNWHNCLRIRVLAELYKCIDLRNSTEDFINENLSQIQNSDEFKNQKPNEIEELIKSIEIEVSLTQ